jgi:uncharacterized protein (TIGR04255 family)
MVKRPRQVERLPKAPLAEVVFELRWKLLGTSDTPDIVKVDPGLIPLLDRFTLGMKRHGFDVFRDMSPPLQTAAHSVARRFFKGSDSAFPIMQLGPGIVATNESSLYEWNSFKAQITTCLRVLLSSYPKIPFFRLEPSLIELRYIDAFDKSLLGTAGLLEFLERGTSMKVQLPDMLIDKTRFSGETIGRIALSRALKGWKNSRFFVDIGSGKRAGGAEDIVRLETKVQCEGTGVPALKGPAGFLRNLNKWLEFAHGLTRPFFKEFVLPDLMQKFAEP